MKAPRENLYRGLFPAEGESAAVRLRSAQNGGGMPTMFGHFVVWDEWTEVHSSVEGHFFERFLAGSFAKNFRERFSSIRVMFQHGKDPSIGMKLLGKPTVLEEEEAGAYYEVPLFDTPYNHELIPGIEAGAYGASFRFTIHQEDWVQRPRPSERNPDGIPERSVKEARCWEFGPVTWGQYSGATAGLRSLTDEVMLHGLVGSGRLPELAQRSGISLAGVGVPVMLGAVTLGDGGGGGATGGNGGNYSLSIDRAGAPDDGRIYKRCRQAFTNDVWCIEKSKLQTIATILHERAHGQRLSREEIRERIGGDPPDDPEPKQVGKVAVLPLMGVMIPRADALDEMSGAQSVERLQKQLRAALADPEVGAVLLDVDSPGGSSALVQELADTVYAARDGGKPVWAIANAVAASGAYWVLAAAEEAIVTPSGMVGSIGAYMMHTDLSVALEKDGIDITYIYAGEHKVDGNPTEPLSDDAREEMQGHVDGVFDRFVGAVARGRGVSTQEVLDNMGQGRMFQAGDAVARGMVDRIATVEDTISALAQQIAQQSADTDAGQAALVVATGDDTDSDEEPEPIAATTPRRPEPDSSVGTTPPVAATEVRSSEPPAPSQHVHQEDNSIMSTFETETDQFQPSFRTIEDKRQRQADILAEIQDIDSRYPSSVLPDDARLRWDSLQAEHERLDEEIRDMEARAAQVKKLARNGGSDAAGNQRVSFEDGVGLQVASRGGDPFDLSTIRANLMDPSGWGRELKSRAMYVLERSTFPWKISREDAQAQVAELLETKDTEDGVLARRLLLTGSPTYRRAFGKVLQGAHLTQQEQIAVEAVRSYERAMSTGTGSAGGFAVPFQLDPTVVVTSNGSVNPLRRIARVERIVSNEWRGVTSEGITAEYVAEATEAGDDSPVLAQPAITPERAQAFVPFSIEIGQDWSALQSEMARMLNIAKDDLEADKFVLGAGSGSDEPEGVVAGLDVGSHVLTAAANTFADEDVYALTEELPPRFRPLAQFVANKAIYNKVRQFDTQGGAQLWMRIGEGLADRPSGNTGAELVGYPANEASAMASAVAGSALILLIGDFQHYVIVDRVGMSIEVIPHLFGANRRPTGQRGLYAFWRNSAEIIADNAFRLLKVDPS